MEKEIKINKFYYLNFNFSSNSKRMDKFKKNNGD